MSETVQRECGLQALVYALQRDAPDVRRLLVERFGQVHINGHQMRSLMTALGWQWVNTAGATMGDLPAQGRLVVVMRRGFTARIDGEQPEPDWSRHGRVCGYYTQPAR
ncbi:hypothetical protein KIH27_00465 [Mycobacterium sp. M1]|uniref:Peptidase C39 domain-containing protein n=1 Tax=Mycolicibacter acidiphilus TaxID=2835306 RepID=A0ABS5RER0_9MYCO|nr:hypothetical protein [Mycolicibacter acidiphilus]MBS9532058.1 hypothetical protein [Mycolicibacter acidiphilus]